MDVIQENCHCSFVKKQENWNGRPSCSFNKSNSPLNSLSMGNMNGNSLSESTTNHDGYSTEILEGDDVMLLTLQIGDKKLENVAIKSECLLQDLAEEFAENETIQVAYFLNETIKKGGAKCDVTDAQVLVKLRPNWKWIPIDDIFDDLTLTVEEALTDIPEYLQLVFSLAPRAHSFEPESSTVHSTPCDSNQEQFVEMVTDLKSLFSKYHVDELLDGDSPQEMDTSDTDMRNVQELKQVLHELNTMLTTKFHDPSILRQLTSTKRNKETQIPENEQLNSPSSPSWPTPTAHVPKPTIPMQTPCQSNVPVNHNSEVSQSRTPGLQTSSFQKDSRLHSPLPRTSSSQTDSDMRQFNAASSSNQNMSEECQLYSPLHRTSSGQTESDFRQFNSTSQSNSISQILPETRPFNSQFQNPSSLAQSIDLLHKPSHLYTEQLSNDLPTQAFNGSVQYEAMQEAPMKSPSDETSAPLSRVRVQFDRSFETPLLKQWFEENPVPSKTMIDNYVDILNSREIRSGKDPVTSRAVYIWFKNTRARSSRKKTNV